MTRFASLFVLGVFFALALSSCRSSRAPSELRDAETSPKANILPAPVLTIVPSEKSTVAATGSASSAGAEAPPPIQSLRGDRPVTADLPAKESAGYTLQVALVTEEGTKKKSELKLVIDFGVSRARWAFAGHGFVLPVWTELRSRADRYGHVLMLPGEDTYRVVAPGAMHALLDDRRIDVAPISPAEIFARGPGSRRLGYKTRKSEVNTRAARAVFEIARLPEAQDGGVLVCRSLLDLINAPPSTALCGTDDVPLHVTLHFTPHGGATFDVASITRSEIPTSQLMVPPASATFTSSPLPLVPSENLAASSSGADGGNAGDSANPVTRTQIMLINSTDQLRFAYLDGAAVAWVAPGASLALEGFFNGKYQLEWRTFFSEKTDGPLGVSVPGRYEIGGTEAAQGP